MLTTAVILVLSVARTVQMLRRLPTDLATFRHPEDKGKRLAIAAFWSVGAVLLVSLVSRIRILS